MPPNSAQVPIIMLTARTSEDDCVRGLREGADEYVTEPFSFRELAARVDAMLRRSSSRLTPTVYRGAHLLADFDAVVVSVDGEPIRLTRREFELLRYLVQNRNRYLVRNRNRVVSRQRLLESVWGYERDLETRSVDVHIGRLRAKLRTAGAQIELSSASATASSSNRGRRHRPTARSGVAPALLVKLFDLAREPGEVALDTVPLRAPALIGHTIVRALNRVPSARAAGLDVKGTCFAGADKFLLIHRHCCNSTESGTAHYDANGGGHANVYRCPCNAWFGRMAESLSVPATLDRSFDSGSGRIEASTWSSDGSRSAVVSACDRRECSDPIGILQFAPSFRVRHTNATRIGDCDRTAGATNCNEYGRLAFGGKWILARCRMTPSPGSQAFSPNTGRP